MTNEERKTRGKTGMVRCSKRMYCERQCSVDFNHSVKHKEFEDCTVNGCMFYDNAKCLPVSPKAKKKADYSLAIDFLTNKIYDINVPIPLTRQLKAAIRLLKEASK